jgi:hypothetical protein
VGLRRPRFAQESEALRRQLTELVLERQALREQRASPIMLEQNRLDIVQAQLELSRALVSEHASASAA